MTGKINGNDVLNRIPAGIILYCPSSGIIQYVNGSLLTSLHYPSIDTFAQETGMDLHHLLDEPEYVRLEKNGSLVSLMFHDAQGNQKRLIASVSSVSEDQNCLVLLDEEIRRQIMETDVITSLPGRNEFLSQAERKLKQEQDGSWAFLYLNIFHFRNVNLSYGTDKGDHILKSVADLLKQYFPDDLISRISADHFAVLTHGPDAVKRCKDLHTEISRRFARYSIFIKTGIYPCNGTEKPADALEKAKAASNSLRSLSGSLTAVYTKDLEVSLHRNQYIHDHIDEAIEQGWIQAYYQPVIRTVSGGLCGMEALARWVDPVHGVLVPSDFIGILERSHQTWKLDKCIIENVCRNFNECMKSGDPIVPVSINLSRADFFDTDIFGILEDTLRKYDVPRDMIHIEITESMFVHDSMRISREIDRFHSAGYQVWMDDFGSGYSSLNILKDYDFDELKIDMKFLSAFTDKSRSIITSAISMSKHIGTQTLAEGVETKEQYDFLRRIGCEKVQGYLFGKPLPYRESLESIRKQGIQIETRALKSYYDAVSRIDFMDSRALAIVEDDHVKFRIVYANEPCQEILDRLHIDGIQEAEAIINSPQVPAGETLRRETGFSNEKEHVFIIPYQEGYLRFMDQQVSSLGTHTMHALVIENINEKAAQERKETLDSVLRNLYFYYDSISVIDYEKQEIHQLIGTPVPLVRFEGSSIEDIRMKTAKMIYPYDRNLWLSFTSPDTLAERISRGGGFITGYFRTRMEDGSYHWKAHIISTIAQHHQSFVYCIHSAAVDDPHVVSELMHHYGEDRSSKNILFAYEGENIAVSESEMWENLLSSTNVHYFWKDSQRRFVGASRSFLDYYNLKSLDDIVGKTDEDMNWHVNNDPYRSDEYAVLHGARVINAPGKCIIRGVVHNIAASKYPIYKDGKIVGLIGHFVDIDSIGGHGSNLGSYVVMDTLTHLSNARGIMDAWIEYTEDSRLRGNQFAAIFLSIKDIRRIHDSYGCETANALISNIASIITSRISTRGSAGRLYGAEFVIFYRYADKPEVETLCSDLSTAVSSIHFINNASITLFPEVNVLYGPDASLDHLEQTACSSSMSSAQKEQIKAYKVLMNPKSSVNTEQERTIQVRMQELNTLFDTVRLVDPLKEHVLDFDRNGNLVETDISCHAAWGYSSRCINCSSLLALRTHKRQFKYEFVNDEAWFVVSEYVVVQSIPCVMECLLKLSSLTLSALGKNRFHKLIRTYSRKYYSDGIESARNHLYYDEIAHCTYCSGVALIRILDLDDITASHGYAIASSVLIKAADLISASLRSTDTVIHYSKDVFLVAFNDMASRDAMSAKLKEIRKIVKENAGENSDLHIRIRIGAVYADAPVEALMDTAQAALKQAEKYPDHICIADIPD